MKLRMYWSYATRSLARGGQRTLLAIFCVAVGVMAIVSLQLVGNMVNNALTSNVREGNGGDISIRSDITPLSADKLASFQQLEAQGTITNFSAISTHEAQTSDANGETQFYSFRAVDPSNFPIAGSPVFLNPSDGTFSSILIGDTVIVNDSLLKQLGAHRGDAITVSTNDGRTLHVTIGGVIASAGFFNEPQMFMSLDAYSAVPSTSGLPVTYSAIYVNVQGHTDANADTAKQAITRLFPLSTVTTTKDALKDNQDQVQQIRYFLQIVGLLALLIGGVGIINTMQVLLRRRRTEIAMLKTAGYRRRDLYALFGLEAALLGLVGGVVGTAAGVGVSFLVKDLVERAIFLHLPAIIDPLTIGAGVAIGLFTALIFGLMPIVQASEVRPQAVLRELPEGSNAQSIVVTILLAALLALLFFGLAEVILQNFQLAIISVAGTGAFLALLSVAFGLVVLAISKLPVVERFHWRYLLLIGIAVASSAAITLAAPAFGILFLAVSALGLVVVVLPRTWKANIKMALRNIGRQKARTVTTLVALFIGVFAIGLILVLGQNIKDKINTALASKVQYNSFVIAGTANKAAVDSELQHVSGIQGKIVNTVSRDTPLAINGTPISTVLQGVQNGGNSTSTGRQEALAYLAGVEGYNLADHSTPDVTILKGAHDTLKGRNLSAADAGSYNVLMPLRSSLAPLNLKLGDTITVIGEGQKKPITVTVVGFYQSLSFAGASMYADNSVASALSNGRPFYVYQLKLDPKQAKQILRTVQAAVPTVQTFSLVDLTLLINSLLNNLIIMLTAIASLAMIAGIIIIANAVALAMLERRRELGILKAVGHTSRSVLSEVLLENGVVGFTGGLLAMLLVTLAMTVLGKVVFKTDFGVGAPIVLGTVLATGAVSMLIAATVAWTATRVRPLEVLRYE